MEYLITEDLPDGVPLVASFHHYFNRLFYYYPRLPDGVRTPETEFFTVTGSRGGLPSFDDHEIAHWMREQDYQQAFVRGDYSSAKVYPRKGSLIYEPTADVVRDTIANLIRDLITQDRELGGRIAVRELLDLDYCPRQNRNHLHHNEVRYFIRDGEIEYCTDTVEEWCEMHYECDETFSYVEEDLDGISFPDEQAQMVAERFDDLAWSVDFARDAKTGEWYCIDMGLDGLYWISETEEWHVISGHGNDRCGKSPENYVDQMPEPKDLSRRIA